MDRNAKYRAHRYREANLIECLPDTRAIDAAVTAGLAAWLAEYFPDTQGMRESKAINKLIFKIETALKRSGIDISHPITRSRLRTRLRLGASTAIRQRP